MDPRARSTHPDKTDPEQDPRARSHIYLSDWESVIDRQIREAMERGEFDNLSGRGKPLNLARDPNVPREWELAFKLLKDAGLAPEWIELCKEICAAREQLFAPLKRALANPLPPREGARRIEALLDQFRAGAADLNRAIDLYNLKAPTQVHLRRIRIEDEIRQFREAWREKSEGK